jgi:hypothetical protein
MVRYQKKYSYVTFDIMLAPDPMSHKVLQKIFWLIVHSIIGTLGSSFLVRNGGASKWSLSTLTALIILIVSSGTWLSLFLLRFLLFFFLDADIVGSLGRYSICGCAGESWHFLTQSPSKEVLSPSLAMVPKMLVDTSNAT